MPEIHPPEFAVVREDVGTEPRVVGHRGLQRFLGPDAGLRLVVEDGDAFAGGHGQELHDREIVVASA